VLALMAEGLSDRGIADRLSVSPTTVSTHVQNVYRSCEYRMRREITGGSARSSPTCVAGDRPRQACAAALLTGPESAQGQLHAARCQRASCASFARVRCRVVTRSEVGSMVGGARRPAVPVGDVRAGVVWPGGFVTAAEVASQRAITI